MRRVVLGARGRAQSGAGGRHNGRSWVTRGLHRWHDTPPISGRSRSQRRLTVAWLIPNTAPAKSWVTFLRIRHTTRATDRNSPSASGGPAETNLSPHSSCSRATRSVSCSLFSPVIASYRNSSSPILARCLRTPNKTGRAVAPQARHAPVSTSRSNRKLPPRNCGRPTNSAHE